MILSNVDIQNRICLEENDAMKIDITPFIEKNLQPASYDITLGNTFKIIEPKQLLSMSSNTKYKTVVKDTFTLYPKKFVLATTKEYIKLPLDITAKVDGRSSYGRMGLDIQNAGFIDPGFEGEITLEIRNESSCPIILNAGTKIGQIVFSLCNTPASKGYDGKYNKQTGATGQIRDF